MDHCAVARLLVWQQEINRASAGNWAFFAGHRRRLTQLVRRGLPEWGGRLCVLGAGNCNDLDLSALCAACAEVHLVDIDGAAVVEGVVRQLDDAPADARALAGIATPRARCVPFVHGGIELSGIWAELERLEGERTADTDIDRLVERARVPSCAPILGQFDLVVSACTLQLLSLPQWCTFSERTTRA